MKHIKLAAFLTMLCLIGMLLSLPYLITVFGNTPPAAAKIPLPAGLAITIGHLPAVYQIFGQITPILLVRTLIMNGLLGLLYGYLYWKKGLEYGMIAHGIGDIFLHGFFG